MDRDLDKKPSEFLTPESFRKLKSYPYLKGLLKPFKGKGDFDLLARQATELREALNQFVRDMNDLMRYPPWSLLDIELRTQWHRKAGTYYLRWRSRTGTRMGVHVWVRQMLNPKTPPSLLEELNAIEQMRISINMQVAQAHFVMSSALSCAEKSAHAEAVLARRLAGETIEIPQVKLSFLEHLPAWTRPAYLRWKQGENLREVLSHSAYYRHKNTLREYGLDISKPYQEVMNEDDET